MEKDKSNKKQFEGTKTTITPSEIEEQLRNYLKLVFLKSENAKNYREELIKKLQESEIGISSVYKDYFIKNPYKFLHSGYELDSGLTRDKLTKHLETGPKQDAYLVSELIKSIDFLYTLGGRIDNYDNYDSFTPCYTLFFPGQEIHEYLKKIKKLK